MGHWRLYWLYLTIMVAVAIGICTHLKRVVSEMNHDSALEEAVAYLERSR